MQQQPAERDAPAFAARQLRDIGVRRWQAQRVHRQFQLRVEIPRVRRVDLVLEPALFVEHFLHLFRREIFAEPGVHFVVARQQRFGGGDALFDVAEHGFRRVEPWFLVQKADRNPLAGKRFADEARVFAGHDLEERALAGAVQAEHADLGAEVERQPDVFEHFGIGRVHFPEPLHRVDKLRHRIQPFYRSARRRGAGRRSAANSAAKLASPANLLTSIGSTSLSIPLKYDSSNTYGTVTKRMSLRSTARFIRMVELGL